MTARILDGGAIAARRRVSVAERIRARLAVGRLPPGLATVLVGENPASQTYVKAKQKACAEVGIVSHGHELPADTSQAELESLIDELNVEPAVHGILVQLPLPERLDEERILGRVRKEKDVDGFGAANLGLLAQKGREPYFLPATPFGIMVLLEEAGVELSGARAVVIGRSNIVGMPTALLLVRRNATVTICHSRTRDLASVAQTADVLIAAIGRPEFVRGDWIKPGAVVIDVGVNRVEDASRKGGYRLVGDVAFDEAVEVAAAISPVPGGVGPMTVAMLLENTLTAAERADETVST